ncbi:hypothetical protein BH09ACT5_BH09ACT5_01210 [soil metagenome]
MTDSPRLAPGDSITWAVNGVSYVSDSNLSGAEHVSQRGQTITLTAALFEANADRTGFSMFEIFHDEEAQLDRWGKVLALPGEHELTPWEPNTEEAFRARDDAVRQARLITNDAGRAEALRAVEEEFGRDPNPSKQTSYFIPSDAERAEILKKEGLRE